MKLIECVPNFSEGRDMSIVHAIRDRIAAVGGVSILHVTADAWHNRSVITFVAEMDVMVDAAIAAIRAARDHIDLREHSGVHPRIGAADVVPFVPLDGATMDDCIAVARAVGERVGAELGIPVFLYERAATNPERRNLANVRRGGFEKLQDSIAHDPERAPDFGPRELHPTAGAVAIGARPFLVAFNAYIGAAANIAAARDIARVLRESNGGLPGVKALGLEVDGQAQVSMNLVDIEQTSVADAYAAVEREARARGLDVTWTELIGLVPERAAFELASRSIGLRDDVGSHVLERLLLEKRFGQSVREYVASVGDGDPFPGGGSVAAIAASLASALISMVASITIGRERYAAVEPEMQQLRSAARELAAELQVLAARDSEAYARVIDARRLRHDTPELLAQRNSALRDALLEAILVPLSVARAASKVAEFALQVATSGNTNAITDAGVAALLASAACTGAGYNVRVNAREIGNSPESERAVEETLALAAAAESVASSVAGLVNAAL